MPSINAQQSNPFSTGGGGGHFEEHVQSAFVVLMLSNGLVPCLPPWPLKKIKLQGKHLGYNTDDFIAYAKDINGNGEAKLLAQIKHSITISGSSGVFEEVIKAAWSDFNNSTLFDPLCDNIALITGPLSSYEINNTRIILEWARTSENSEEFVSKVYLSKFSSKTKQDKFGAFKIQLKKANNNSDLTDEQIWQFLKSFYLLGYDLDIKAGVTHSLLNSLIKQYSSNEVNFIWSQILAEVSYQNQNAGTISFESLPDHLKKPFEKLQINIIPQDYVKNPKKEKINWFESQYQSELAIACLIGSWNEENESDITIIEKLININYEDWIKNLRKIVTSENSPLTFKNRKWKFSNRVEGFKSLGTLYFDDHLEKVKKISVEVLTELDPKFELKPDERFAAQAKGKVFNYSNLIRKGLASGLAIIGSKSTFFTSASTNKAESVVNSVVVKILKSSNWALWASLDHFLPLLAEAAPNKFLTALEKLTTSDSSVFDALFEQEGKGIVGGIYNSGMLWALETLAWDKQHLTRVTVILGYLASIDPGGNYANRPANSLTTIFLPWLPQTCAPISKRKTAIANLIKEFPNVAWKLLISLIPKNKQSSSGSAKPVFRKLIDASWTKGVSPEENYDQVSKYTELIINTASEDILKMNQLIAYLDRIPIEHLNKILSILDQEKYTKLNKNDKFELWSRLTAFIKRQRKYEHTDWTLNREELDKLATISDKLSPDSIMLKFKPLFSNNDHVLIEDQGNWDQQYEKLERTRQKSIMKIYSKYKFKGLVDFVISAEAPKKVGYSFGIVGPEKSVNLILPGMLSSTDQALKSFAEGFVEGRLKEKNWKWVDKLLQKQWTELEIVNLLLCLPFKSQTWDLVSKYIENESLYWSKVFVYPYGEIDKLEAAIEKLIKYKRSMAALNCLHTIFRKTNKIDSDLAKKALLLSNPKDKIGEGQMDVYCIVEIIKALQSKITVSKKDLINIEWQYLPLLNKYNNASPILLETALVEDPKFYCEIIQTIYRSSKDKSNFKKTLSQQQKNLALNAYELLDNWKTPPGNYMSGTKNKKPNLKAWLKEVRKICNESGHLDIAMSYVGRVLIHSPADPEGIWIHKEAADELNTSNATDMRNAFGSALFNMRGFHAVDPSGKQEIDLANKYLQQADDVEDAGFYRLATVLRGLAEGYKRDAERVKSRDRFED
jgi:hypothetical protein